MDPKKLAKIVGWISLALLILGILLFLVGLFASQTPIPPLNIMLSISGLAFGGVYTYGFLKTKRWVVSWLIVSIIWNIAGQIINLFTRKSFIDANSEFAKAAQDFAPGIMGSALHIGPALLLLIFGLIFSNIINIALFVYFRRHKGELSA